MIELININTGQEFYGEELEYFIDDDNAIGEVHLDGDLIFQHVECYSEDQLKKQLYTEFAVRYDIDDDNIYMDQDEYEL